MMKNVCGLLLIIGIILIMLSTAFLVHYEKPRPRDEIDEMVRRLQGKSLQEDRTTSENMAIAYVLLSFGILSTIIGMAVSVRQKSDRQRFFAVPMEYLSEIMIGFTVARIVASALLIWALGKHSYDYYTLLRFVVCGATAYGIYLSVRFKQITWAWIFGIVAVLFNPIFPIQLERGTWAIIDVIIVVLLIISIFVFRSTGLSTGKQEGK